MENDIMIWDVAGGIAIARAAGCVCTMKNGIKPNSFRLLSPMVSLQLIRD